MVVPSSSLTPLAAPALPLHTAGKYVAAAYIVAFTVILVYVSIMAVRVRRMQGTLDDLAERAGEATHEEPAAR
jgi:hypothetical protein